MVPKIYPAGKSFAGLATYLSHDAGKAKTSERVAWTHTLNLANDDIPSAVHEMLWTCRAADQLKRRAGIGTGGSKLENPVKHYSLNWHPTDTPTREEMIEAVQGFMAHLGIQDRQAVLFAHNDKPYAHVHLMVNSVSPADGRSISTSFEKARASSWALAYEREHFGIHCEQRLKPYEEREPSPTRATWEKLKEYARQDNQVEQERVSKDFDYFERGDGDTAISREWRALKAHQRAEREQFFAGGKEAYREVRNAAYREVRELFRPQWQNFYQMKRDGMDPELLAALKTEIIADQKLELDIRRAEMSGKLRKERDEQYDGLLRHHREERAELTERQSEGLRSYALLILLTRCGRRPSARKSCPARSGERADHGRVSACRGRNMRPVAGRGREAGTRRASARAGPGERAF